MSVKHGAGESSITLSLNDMVDVLYSSNNRKEKGIPHLDSKNGPFYEEICNSDYSSDEYSEDFDEESFRQIIAERQAERENYWISKCEADKLANQLIAEEKLEKEKEEKKKAKKKKKKERQKAKNKDKSNSSEKDENEERPALSTDNHNTTTNSDERKPLPFASGSTLTGLARGEMEHSENASTRLPSQPIEDDDNSIDTNSAFFARVAGKAPTSSGSNQSNKTITAQVKTKPVRTATESKSSTESNRNSNTNNRLTERTANNTSPDGVTDLVRKSRELAIEANRMAALEKYKDAIRLFKDAIKIDSTDFRFFGNRSFCYERIGDFKSALADADSAIMLAPQWPKGHYRKGRSLVGLNKYKEAEAEFEIVIRLEGDSQDAMFELTRVRTLMLVDMGFDVELATIAVSEHETFQASLDALLEGRVEPESDVYSSNEEDASTDSEPFTLATSRGNHSSQNKSYAAKLSAKATTTTAPMTSPAVATVPLTTDDSQPLRSCAVWVGNINPDAVSESVLKKLFNRCGRVAFVKILPAKKCAFVNYDRVKDAELAIENLQNAELGGKNLLLKFSNNPPPGYVQSTASVPSSSAPASKSGSSRSTAKPSATAQQECSWWRAGGCTFSDKCHYKHIPDNRGIDKR